MKIKLISCNYGGHRQVILNNPNEIKELGVEVVNYDDSNTLSRSNSLHPRLKGKIPKMLEWEKEGDYDYYIWVDSKFTLNEGAITKLISYMEGYDLCLFEHPNRSSIKSEYDFMDMLMKGGDGYLHERYNGEDMLFQINKYIGDSEFVDDKLFACGCFVYSKRLVENKEHNLLKEWFYHNAVYSIQDQLSLPYLLQKFETKYNIYDFNLLGNHLLKHG